MAAEARQARFAVMGSAGHLLVTGGPATLPASARSRLAELESLWSRFRPDSELCRLNASPGRWLGLSEPTVALVSRAVRAWELTGGLFDPTILPALEAAGYTGTFEHLPDEPPPGAAPGPAPGCAGIEIRDGLVRLPPGVRLDFGGIGKGYAADLVAGEMKAAGATGACVNLGGDLRATGSAPGGGPWVVAVEDEARPGTDLAWLALAEGAVATSTRLRRRWRHGERDQHHLIDPLTGVPATNPVVSVTVVAGEAHWAEALAKAALIGGLSAGRRLLDTHGVGGVLVTEDGARHCAGDWERFVTWTPDCGGTSPASAG
ncbi:Thiamin biosynthesis lipoprotein ApbE [Alloactinosynnema sp. L-07]|uniref:FAD:protein FMN transferase n=1 Tax=Alloactinosynnema sp. L-07 TaxID=1653480 RepID=UPI00065F0441|nr:FAD:protein FMN transferase [Alloactinosynnema sp. L-07]CRK55270.1 Thiamin biosynthesis lipoprotein ApbE [Alloactinosynnema sp. L-07]